MSDNHASQAIPATSVPDQAGKPTTALQRALSKLGWVGGDPTEAAQIPVNPSGTSKDGLIVTSPTFPSGSPPVKGSEGRIAQADATPTETSTPTQTNEQASKQFAALARQEKALRQRESDLKAQLNQLQEAKRALPAWKPEEVAAFEQYQSLKGSKKYNEALQALGLSYEELTEYQLTGKLPETDPGSQAKADLEAFKAELRAKEENSLRIAQETQKQAYDKALNDFRVATNEFILTNKDKYELIDIHGAQEVVLAVIEANYQRSVKAGQPRVMTIQEAADMVEADLTKRIEASLATKKLSAKATPAKSSEPEFKPSTKESPSRTLTNAMTASGTSTTPARNEKDRIARAMAALSRK